MSQPAQCEGWWDDRSPLSSDAGKRERVLLPQTFCSVQTLEGLKATPPHGEGLYLTEPTHSNPSPPTLGPGSSPPGGQMEPQAAVGGVKRARPGGCRIPSGMCHQPESTHTLQGTLCWLALCVNLTGPRGARLAGGALLWV